MAEESLDPIFSMSPALLKKNLGIVLAKHTQEYPNNIIIKKLPCLGRIHFVRDREGITFLSCIVAYWVYGILSSYYCVLLPHYQDGRFPVGVIYYHLTVAALCLISLVRAATLNPGRVPLIDDTKLSENKDWVICQRCLRPKPERAHHCRRCQQCVMKMDHHCPWINNCVGEANHHVFVLLLFYAMMFGLNTFVFLMLHFWVWPKCQLCDHEVFYVKHGIWFHYLSTVMSAAMAFVMLTQLINQHWFIRMDTTTVESMKEQESKTYNKYIRPIHYKTTYKAYTDLFGTKIFCLWFFSMSKKTIIVRGQSSSCIVVTGCSNKSFLEVGK